MQGKGIIRFFLIVIAIVCLIQYMYLLPTRGVERNAETYATAASSQFEEGSVDYIEAFHSAERKFLDSVSNETVFKIPLIKEYTYSELKAQQLALGLDLKGGMSVVLQVDLKKFLLALSDENRDPDFRKALDQASKQLKSSQEDYITLFGQAFEEINSEKKLATIFARNSSLREDINYETSNGEVLQVLRETADETVKLTFNRLKERIDKFGVTQPNVSLDEARDLILVELPGIDNPERARNYLQATAQLEFWEVYRVSDPGIVAAFQDADKKLKQRSELGKEGIDSLDNSTAEDGLDSLSGDSIGDLEDLLAQEQGPLFKIFTPNTLTEEGSILMPLNVMGSASKANTDKVLEYLQRPEIKTLFPRDIGFRFGADPAVDFETNEETNDYYLYAIKMPKGENNPPLEGDVITEASSQPDPNTGEISVSLEMDQQGARKWGQMTTRAAKDNNREIAITLDGEVVSAPRVNTPITDGRSSISGNFTVQEAQDLANILEIGKLPAETNIIQSSVVGPSLGSENIQKSMYSLLIGFLLVLVFMILYYGSSGVVSIICLFANLFFIFGALSSYGTVLTLPGIAGIVLTIGMAVDANVIIFERIREELREGKSLKVAIANGFQYSYSAIIDANVTTILVAIVLSIFGLGPIKGFAVVLIIGVICTIITAVLLGRLIIDWWVGKGNDLSFWTSFSKNLFADLKIDWMGKRKVAYVVSGVLIAISLISFAVRGFELGVDFKGGYSYFVEFDESQNVEADQIRSTLTGIFGEEPIVKAVNTQNTYNVTTAYGIDSDDEDIDQQVVDKLYEGVNQIVGGGLTKEQFNSPEFKGTHITSFNKVGPTIADDIVNSSYYATIFALLLIFVYILIRFSRWQYSAGAVMALFHDTIIVLGLFSLLYGFLPFSLEIDQAFIAALLTVIGYSINDTVIVFDRIREFFNTYTNKPKNEIINMAINNTVSRTVITSLTTLLVVLILFVFGGSSIRGFAFALLIGVIVGTYSSIFVATPTMADLTKEVESKSSKNKSKSKAKV